MASTQQINDRINMAYNEVLNVLEFPQRFSEGARDDVSRVVRGVLAVMEPINVTGGSRVKKRAALSMGQRAVEAISADRSQLAGSDRRFVRTWAMSKSWPLTEVLKENLKPGERDDMSMSWMYGAMAVTDIIHASVRPGDFADHISLQVENLEVDQIDDIALYYGFKRAEWNEYNPGVPITCMNEQIVSSRGGK